MELIKNELDTLRPGFRSGGSFRQEQELVIPDIRPDARRVIFCTCSCTLGDKVPGEGRIRLGGEIAVTAFCEGAEGEVYPVSAMIAYGESIEAPGVSSSDICLLRAEPLQCTGVILNSRKIKVSCQIGWRAEMWKPASLLITSGIAAARDEGVCTDIRRRECGIITAMVQKRVAVTEEVRLTAGTAPGDCLCRCDVRWIAEDVKLLTGKAMIRGMAEVTAVSLSAAGSFVSREKLSLPFSQMLDVPGASETDRAEVRFDPVRVDASLQTGQDGGAYLSITAACEATLTASRTEVREILADAYSTCLDLGCKTGSTELPPVWGRREETVQLGETLSPDPPCVRVLDHYLVLSPGIRRAGAAWRLGVLYETAEGGLAWLSHSGEASAEGDAPCTDAELSSSKAAADGTGGIGFSASLRLFLPMGEWTEAEQVVAVAPSAMTSENGKAARVILRSVRPGEDLWSIAKSCRTTVEAVMGANGLAPGEQPAPGRLILIPFAANRFGG